MKGARKEKARRRRPVGQPPPSGAFSCANLGASGIHNRFVFHHARHIRIAKAFMPDPVDDLPAPAVPSRAAPFSFPTRTPGLSRLASITGQQNCPATAASLWGVRASKSRHACPSFAVSSLASCLSHWKNRISRTCKTCGNLARRLVSIRAPRRPVFWRNPQRRRTSALRL